MSESEGPFKLTCGHQVTSRPLLGTLLDHFEKILAVVIILDQVRAVDDHNQWRLAFAPSLQGNFLQLVEGTLDVQESGGISRALDTEKTPNITR